MDDLTLQIGKRHGVVIDDAQGADSRGGKIEQYRRAEPAGTDHEHPGASQGKLARSTDLVQHDVAGVTLEFFVAQHRFPRALYRNRA